MGFSVVLICILSSLSFAKGEGGCRELHFLDCHGNKTLQHHVIKSIRMLTPALKQCQHECFKDDRCVSFNFGPVFGVIRSCELNDADHVGYPNDVIAVTGGEYCPIKNPCSSNPCVKDKICTPDFAFNTYQCTDPPKGG